MSAHRGLGQPQAETPGTLSQGPAPLAGCRLKTGGHALLLRAGARMGLGEDGVETGVSVGPTGVEVQGDPGSGVTLLGGVRGGGEGPALQGSLELVPGRAQPVLPDLA